jgi:hypothetical protein
MDPRGMNVPFMDHEPSHLRIEGKGNIVETAVTADSSGTYARLNVDIDIGIPPSNIKPGSDRQRGALSPGRAGRLIGIDIYNIIVYIVTST